MFTHLNLIAMSKHASWIIALTGLMICSMNFIVLSQAPPSFKYQAVVRDKTGQVLASQDISLQISILQSTTNGPEIYREVHSVTTSELGLVNIEVGRGKSISGSMAAIDWGGECHFLRIEMDPSGGTNFELMGISELLSVPYALYAEKSGSGMREADLDWEVIGNDVVTGHGGSYPAGNVGIGNNSPGTLLYAAKNMGEPTITIRNIGGGGGATYSMVDDLSGADWKFKATTYGGFKIRDHANSMDVLVFEPNSAANSIYIKSGGNVGVGTATPHASAKLEVNSNNAGFLPPRLTTTERNNIAGPAAGLVIYNRDEQCLNVYNGTGWVSSGGATGWSLTGNSGTDPIVNFLGTTDNQPLKFRVNNATAGEINQTTNNTFLGLHSGGNSTGTNNTAMGREALSSNTGGFANTAIGSQALYSNMTGYFNTASGYNSLMNNSEGYFNTAFGALTLNANTTGTQNTASGFTALNSNATGNCNTAHGAGALYANTIGNTNTANGFQSLISNISGSDNTASGAGALAFNTNGNYNTASGAGALRSNTSGYDNTASGFVALCSNTTGNSNTASGNWALYSNTTGYSNVAIGMRTLYSNTTRSNLVAIGDSALYNNGLEATEPWYGVANTAMGSKALYSNTIGSSNTANGFRALSSNTSGFGNMASGSDALSSNMTGGANTASGHGALYLNTTGSWNTAGGYEALHLNTTGWANTATGFRALYSNTIGLNNTASGWNALYSNTTGYSNVAVGINALYSNTTRSNLVAIGDSALFNNGVGTYESYHAVRNTAIGTKSLYSNTIGWYNTAIGYQALYYNTAGSGNTASGMQALYHNTTGTGNMATGRDALHYNTTGDNNTAAGSFALNRNTDGDYNTACGYVALYSNTTGYYNTASGSLALWSNTTGYENTASGYRALHYNTTGIKNTANGASALILNTTGDGNTASGRYAMALNTIGFDNTAYGVNSLYNNQTGDYNTACGANSLNENTEENYNTGVGHNAGNFHPFSYGTFIGANAYPFDDGFTNCMALGYNASVYASNQAVIGNPYVTSIGGYAAWTNFSDGRYKKNIRQDVPGLDFIEQLRPITYTLDVTSLTADLNRNRHPRLREDGESWVESPEDKASREAKEKIVYTGFIAQEVEQAARSIGYEFSGVDVPQNSDGHYGLRYAEFVVPLVKAVQEQQAMIEALQQKVAELEAERGRGE